VFCANFLSISGLSRSVKLNLFRPRPLKLDVDGVFPGCESDRLTRENPVQKESRCAKYQRATSKIRPSRWGSREINSRVMQWLVLCGIPNRGSGATASSNPTNWLSTSLIGQAIRPPESSTAQLQLSKSIRSSLLLQLDARTRRLHLLATFQEYQNLTLFAS
jgi:hypothetical protein